MLRHVPRLNPSVLMSDRFVTTLLRILCSSKTQISQSPPASWLNRDRNRSSMSSSSISTLATLDSTGSSSSWKSACFSENTRTQKSPFLWGSKVDGTIRYSPGGKQKRLQTSRRLMKVSDRAAEAWRRKKLRFRWTLLWPLNCRNGEVKLHKTHIHTIRQIYDSMCKDI